MQVKLQYASLNGIISKRLEPRRRGRRALDSLLVGIRRAPVPPYQQSADGAGVNGDNNSTIASGIEYDSE